MWEEIPPERRHGEIHGYTVSGHIQHFRTDTNHVASAREKRSQMVNVSAELRECLMSSNKNESFTVSVNASQLSVVINNLGKLCNGPFAPYNTFLIFPVPYAVYNFTVAASTGAGTGDPSDSQSFRTTVTSKQRTQFQIQ